MSTVRCLVGSKKFQITIVAYIKTGSLYIEPFYTKWSKNSLCHKLNSAPHFGATNFCLCHKVVYLFLFTINYFLFCATNFCAANFFGRKRLCTATNFCTALFILCHKLVCMHNKKLIN